MSVRFPQKYISLRNIRHFGNQAIVYIGVLDIFINSQGFISLTFFGNQINVTSGTIQCSRQHSSNFI